jgi:hypothetical protein
LAIPALAIGLTCLYAVQSGRSEEALVTPQELVAQLQTAVTAASAQDIERLTSTLTQLGDSSLPAIEEGLARGDEGLSVHLLAVLGGVPGDGATSLLVGFVGNNPSSALALVAISRLENRELRRALSPQELAALDTIVRNGSVLDAGRAARVLAHCGQASVNIRLAPLLARFEEEVVSPTAVQAVQISYLSPRVYALNQFLLAFSYLGRSATPTLLQERESTADAELRKWLLLAIGMTGGNELSDELEQLLRNETDRYVRWAAVHAYARAQEFAAMPLLRTLLTDGTQSEYADCSGSPILLIRNAAQDELFRLDQQMAESES